MTATFLHIADAPLRQTVAIVREQMDAVLVWEPRRWHRDVPWEPEPDGRDES